MEKRINDISCRFLFQSLEASFHRKWTLKKKSGKKKQNRQQGRFCFKIYQFMIGKSFYSMIPITLNSVLLLV